MSENTQGKEPGEEPNSAEQGKEDLKDVAKSAIKGGLKGGLEGAAIGAGMGLVKSKSFKKIVLGVVGGLTAVIMFIVMLTSGGGSEDQGGVGGPGSVNSGDRFVAANAASAFNDDAVLKSLRESASSSGAPWQMVAAIYLTQKGNSELNGSTDYKIEVGKAKDWGWDDKRKTDFNYATGKIGAWVAQAAREGEVTKNSIKTTAAGLITNTSDSGAVSIVAGQDDEQEAAKMKTQEAWVEDMGTLPLVGFPDNASAAYELAYSWMIGDSDLQCLPSVNNDMVTVGQTEVKMNETQLKYAQQVINQVADEGLSEHAAVIALATVQQESKFLMYWSNRVPGSKALAFGGPRGSDHHSVGLFQQQVWGNKFQWGTVEDAMNPATSTKMFLRELRKIDGWKTMPITVAAQKVQRSAHPSRYAPWEKMARTLVSDLRPSGKATDYGSDHSHDDMETVVDDKKTDGDSGSTAVSPSLPEGKNPFKLKIETTLKPDTQAVQHATIKYFGEYVYAMGGYRAGSKGHSGRIATDLMIDKYKTPQGVANGDKMAAFFLENREALGVSYIIWQDKIWLGASTGWQAYSGSGKYGNQFAGNWNDTTKHLDHLHVEVHGDRGTGGDLGYSGSTEGSIVTGCGNDGGGNLGIGAGSAGEGDDYPHRNPVGDCSWCKGSRDPGADAWGLYKRECVSFVAWRVNQQMGWKKGDASYPFTMAKMGMGGRGTARYWGEGLAKQGYVVDKNPTVGAVAWWKSNEKNQYYHVFAAGHVAVVLEVHDDDTVTVEQYNGGTVPSNPKRSSYSTLRIHKDGVTGYIHVADLEKEKADADSGQAES